MITNQPNITLAPHFAGKRKERKEATEKAFRQQLPETSAEQELARVERLESELKEAQEQLEKKLNELPELEEADLPEETKALLKNVDEKKLNKFLTKQMYKATTIDKESKKRLGSFAGIAAVCGVAGFFFPPAWIGTLFFGGVVPGVYGDIKEATVIGKMKKIEPERFARVLIAEGVLTTKQLEKMQKKK